MKSELGIAHARIEIQKDLLLDKSAQHHVHISTQASGGSTIHAHDVANSTVVAGSRACREIVVINSNQISSNFEFSLTSESGRNCRIQEKHFTPTAT